MKSLTKLVYFLVMVVLVAALVGCGSGSTGDTTNDRPPTSRPPTSRPPRSRPLRNRKPRSRRPMLNR
jgi:uncharacterized lipoprotein YehR (DUF1307 family)